jgi:hypothetical protein
VVEGKRGGVRVVIVRRDLGDSRRIAGAKRLEQFPGLTLQLIEIGTLGKRARWERASGHDELLSRLRRSVSRAPGVRSLGQKRVHRDGGGAIAVRWTRSFPRTRERPDAQSAR